MRLQKLQIKNFISIKKATVDFEALNDGVFLISGPTGSGKSSMLDAIHWALFGKTLSSNRASVLKEIRSTYAPATEDTVVTLTFNQDKTDYKVIRTLKKDGGSAVQLFTPGIIYDKVKEANDQLEKIIGLSVKQFDQMVMLEQGNFSKFLLADSKTRAEILRDIFDTQLFKDLELRFKDRCTALKNNITNSTDVEQGLLQGELLETVRSQVELTADTIKEERTRLAELQAKHDDAVLMLPEMITYDQENAVYLKAQRELEQLEQLKPEVDELYQKRDVFTAYSGILDWYARYTQVKAEIDKATEDIADYQRRIDGVFVDEELSARVEELRRTIDALNGTLSAIDDLNQKEAELEEYQKQLEELSERKAGLEACIEAYTEARNKLQVRLDTRHKYDQDVELVSQQNAERARMEADITSLQAFIDANSSAYAHLLAQKLIKISKPGVCPICGEPYTDNHKESEELGSIDSKAKQLEIKKTQLEQLQGRLLAMPVLALPECTEAFSYAELMNQWNDLIKKYNDARKDLNDANNQIQSLNGSIEVLKTTVKNLAEKVDDAPACDLKDKLDAAQKEYGELWAKVDDNEMARRSRNLLEGYLRGVEDKQSSLQAKLDALTEEPDAKNDGDKELQEALKNAATVDDYRVHINDYLYKIQQYEMLRDNLLSVEQPENPHPGFTVDSVKQLISDTDIGIQEAIQLISDYQSKLDARKVLIKRVEDLRTEREKNTKDYDKHTYIYNLLSGKNNSKISFETFVLHRQLEWILNSSNQYLSNLSGGQFELQVRWESSSGRTQGGLEITITDRVTGSTRPAQTYSGGELFMLSLSLSLGLMTAIDSLFTARDLNLLFVDEGFGTLDGECLNRTLMTLRDLQNIKSVGIISHVQDLIDTIPQGFIVEKTVTGTKIEMFKNI